MKAQRNNDSGKDIARLGERAVYVRGDQIRKAMKSALDNHQWASAVCQIIINISHDVLGSGNELRKYINTQEACDQVLERIATVEETGADLNDVRAPEQWRQEGEHGVTFQ